MSAAIICISGEAHRSQTNLDEKVVVHEDGVTRSYGFAKYLHESLPNATYVGFTGTPIDATLDVFGAVVDAYIHFYMAVRSIIFKLNKGSAPDIAQMNARVRDMIRDALQSDGVEEIFKLGSEGGETQIDIFDPAYLEKLDRIKLPNTKLKLLQQMLTRAIIEVKKVNKMQGVDFSKKFNALVEHYNERKEENVLKSETILDISDELTEEIYQRMKDLMAEMAKEVTSFEGMGIDVEEKAFYDILVSLAHKYDFEYPEDKTLDLAKAIKGAIPQSGVWGFADRRWFWLNCCCKTSRQP